MSEIDDIFASKGKTKDVSTVPESPHSFPEKKKKDKKKRPKIATAEDTFKENAPAPRKRPLPETIVDPSVLPNNSKRHRTDPDVKVSSKRSKTKKDAKEEEQFKDSRGDGPRRRTEEGWNIYKEDELGLNNEGGETPLCPFDCDCCGSLPLHAEPSLFNPQ